MVCTVRNNECPPKKIAWRRVCYVYVCIFACVSVYTIVTSYAKDAWSGTWPFHSQAAVCEYVITEQVILICYLAMSFWEWVTRSICASILARIYTHAITFILYIYKCKCNKHPAIHSSSSSEFLHSREARQYGSVSPPHSLPSYPSLVCIGIWLLRAFMV